MSARCLDSDWDLVSVETVGMRAMVEVVVGYGRGRRLMLRVERSARRVWRRRGGRWVWSGWRRWRRRGGGRGEGIVALCDCGECQGLITRADWTRGRDKDFGWAVGEIGWWWRRREVFYRGLGAARSGAELRQLNRNVHPSIDGLKNLLSALRPIAYLVGRFRVRASCSLSTTKNNTDPFPLSHSVTSTVVHSSLLAIIS